MRDPASHLLAFASCPVLGAHAHPFLPFHSSSLPSPASLPLPPCFRLPACLLLLPHPGPRRVMRTSAIASSSFPNPTPATSSALSTRRPRMRPCTPCGPPATPRSTARARPPARTKAGTANAMALAVVASWRTVLARLPRLPPAARVVAPEQHRTDPICMRTSGGLGGEPGPASDFRRTFERALPASPCPCPSPRVLLSARFPLHERLSHCCPFPHCAILPRRQASCGTAL